MKPLRSILTLALLATGLMTSHAQALYFPPTDGGNWETLDPAELGWCQGKIDSLYQFLDDEQTRAFIVLKDGRIVLEQYFNGHSVDSLWTWFSAGKSLRAMLVGIAQEQGDLDIYEQTSTYLGSGWTSLTPEQEDRIQVVHQLAMSTGLDETVFDCITPDCLTFAAPAGTRWAYHNGPYNLLKQVLESATGVNHNLYTYTQLTQPIGMTSGFWLPAGNNDFFLSNARDMARFGLLVHAEGTWDGNVILGDAEYFEDMVTPSQIMNPAYGYLWWLNGQESFIPPSDTLSYPGSIAPDAPEDMFSAAGALGQYVSISPSEGLVVIRQGLSDADDLAPINLLNDIWARILDLECGTVGLDEWHANEPLVFPNPASAVITLNRLTGTEVSVRIYDMTGQVVLQSNARNREIDVSQLPPGLYMLEVSDGTERFLEKFIKE